jgi:hypothetical protein
MDKDYDAFFSKNLTEDKIQRNCDMEKGKRKRDREEGVFISPRLKR